MFQPYGAFHQPPALPPRQIQDLLARLQPVQQALHHAEQHDAPAALLHTGAVLGGYMAGRGYNPDHVAAWVHHWLQTAGYPDAHPAHAPQTAPAAQLEFAVQGAEANDRFRALLADSIDDEATAAAFYANLSNALAEAGLEQAAVWVREASRDEQRHLSLLQGRYRELYGATHKAVLGKTGVEDLRSALLIALADEFTDARKYRDAYLAYTDAADQRIFFELMTDEMRHATVFTYALQALR
jgi:rubrerythrin